MNRGMSSTDKFRHLDPLLIPHSKILLSKDLRRLELGIKIVIVSRLDDRSVLGVVEHGTALAAGRSVQSAFRLLQHTQDIPIISVPLVLFSCM